MSHDPPRSEISDDQLRALLAQHHVRYEVRPHKAATRNGTIETMGWDIDLYGSRSTEEGQLPSAAAPLRLRDVMHAIARALVSPETHRVAVEVEQDDGAVHLDPRHHFREEVRARIVVEPLTINPQVHEEGEEPHLEAEETKRLTTRLESLGCHRG